MLFEKLPPLLSLHSDFHASATQIKRMNKQRGEGEKTKINQPDAFVHKSDAAMPSNQENEKEEMEEKFERELAWCVEQIQLGLERQNPDSRQAVEATKVLRILVSAKAPMIKKRQVMRNTFGDYRKKMQEQEKKSAAAAKRMKLLPVEDKGYQNSQFFRKSVKKSFDKTLLEGMSNSQQSEDQNCHATQLSGSEKDKETVKTSDSLTETEGKTNELNRSFQFNFKIDNDSDVELGAVGQCVSEGELNHSHTNSCDSNEAQKVFTFHKSENSFRFNFHCDEET